MTASAFCNLIVVVPFAEPQSFSPQDLDPDFYAESVSTFPNPHSNVDCLGFEDPNYCCTGPGTGICDEPVESFVIVSCTTRNIDCTGPGTPYSCCTGPQVGSCCYEETDSANGHRGNSYCPESVCAEGCVNQWVDQSGTKSSSWSHPITGRALEQDDLEKPCFKTDCLNGHPCLEGHPAWTEPDYPAVDQPYQDATLEFEPQDRTGPFGSQGCPGPFYMAQLVRIVPQTDSQHRLLSGFTRYNSADNRLHFATINELRWSVNNVLPKLDAWYLIEWQRDVNGQLRVWVNEEDRTPASQPASTSDHPFPLQQFCNFKDCTQTGNQEFQGDGAMLLYRCGPPPSAQELAAFRSYIQSTFRYLDSPSVFEDDFETGDLVAWIAFTP